ncbi:hypothetical protein HD806DRAFT_475250 [Xylariaceae sp. AK1471]|nr:hypothetical protein HD806DRAFT_475250 [Xylariaceae sp. AK1471]
MSPPTKPQAISTEQFRRHWQLATDDNNLTLHGFRRFKTTHLLNLRFLEAEIADLDHTLYQVGLNLGLEPSSIDRLALKHSRKDAEVPGLEEAITRDAVLKLRSLVQQYDEALISFNQIMAMETFSLIDDEKQSSLRNDLSLYEVYQTRLLRTDFSPRSRTDPFQRWLHKHLRAFRYSKLSKRSQENTEGLGSSKKGHRWSYQDTVTVADIIARVILVVVASVFLVAPLVILSHQTSQDIQIAISSGFIIALAFLITSMLKVSNLEMMAVSAAYAAVLATFISNVPQKTV